MRYVSYKAYSLGEKKLLFSISLNENATSGVFVFFLDDKMKNIVSERLQNYCTVRETEIAPLEGVTITAKEICRMIGETNYTWHTHESNSDMSLDYWFDGIQ
jgi:hypothetical protein